jgi:hypothetical protein
MEGSVLSFLKAEWKVSDAGSAHWCLQTSLHKQAKIWIAYKLGVLENKETHFYKFLSVRSADG